MARLSYGALSNAGGDFGAAVRESELAARRGGHLSLAEKTGIAYGRANPDAVQQKHLKSCQECRTYIEELKELLKRKHQS